MTNAPTIEHTTVEANGLRFHVATAGSGDRLALCLHGFPQCWYCWRHQFPLLTELGYRVWAPDLRGYNTSDKPPRRRDYALELLMDDVGGLIDASGARSVTLIAHDWGGIIAWLFATRRVRPLERLVLMNIPHPGGFRGQGPNWEQLRRSWYVFFFQIPWLPEWLLTRGGGRGLAEMLRRSTNDPSCFSDSAIDVYRQATLQPGAAKAMVDYYRALVLGGGAMRQLRLGLPQIEVPTLLVWGEEDIALAKASTYGTRNFVKDLTVRYLPGVSHWVQEEAPDTVNAILGDWLSGKVPTAGSEQ